VARAPGSGAVSKFMGLIRYCILLNFIAGFSVDAHSIELVGEEHASYVDGGDGNLLCAKKPSMPAPCLLQRSLRSSKDTFDQHDVNDLLRGDFLVEDLMPAKFPSFTEQSEAADPKTRELFFRPVSTTVYCVMWLTVLTLVVHTSLAAARNSDELSGRVQPSLATEVLSIASRGASCSPVMGLLFLAYRLYILAITKGRGEPEVWVKSSMIIATAGLTLHLVVTVAVMLSTGKIAKSSAPVDGSKLNDYPWLDSKFLSGGWKGISLQVIQISSVFWMYVGIAAVAVGLLVIKGLKPASSAVASAASLAALYFIVESLVLVARTLEQAWASGKVNEARTSAVHAFHSCALSASQVVQKAPMLAVLFLAARMRHLNVNPPDGTSPPYVASAFLSAAIAMYLETIISMYVGFSGRDELGYYQTHHFKTSPWVHLIQHILGGVGFAATGLVFHSLWWEWGPANAPPLSPTMMGVLALSAAFLLVYVGLWLGSVARDVFNRNWATLQDSLQAASIGVGFFPLLCVLFIACRVRALQVTQQLGHPPWWEQECVFITVYAVFIQLFCCLVLPIFTGAATSVDPEGNTTYDLRPMVGAYAVTVVKYLALFGLHGGVVGICTAIFVMTPESAMEARPDSQEIMHSLLRSFSWTLVAMLFAMILSSAKVIGLAVKFAIETADKMIAGIDVHVGSSAISLCRGYVNLGKVVAMNPENRGFKTDHLFKVDRMVVKINVWRILRSFGKSFEITELVMEGVDLCLEKASDGKLSNISSVLQYMEGEATSPAPTQPTQPTQPTSKPTSKPDVAAAQENDIEVVLGRLKIRQIGAQVYHPKFGVVAKVNLGDMDITDFSGHLARGESGDIVKFVLRTLLRTTLSNVEVMGALLSEGAKNILRAFGRRVGSCCSAH